MQNDRSKRPIPARLSYLILRELNCIQNRIDACRRIVEADDALQLRSILRELDCIQNGFDAIHGIMELWGLNLIHELDASTPAQLQLVLTGVLDAGIDVSAFNAKLDREKEETVLEALRSLILDNHWTKSPMPDRISLLYPDVLLLRRELAEEISELERCLERHPQDLALAVSRLIDAIRRYEQLSLSIIRDLDRLVSGLEEDS
jgi:hypothetical protein